MSLAEVRDLQRGGRARNGRGSGEFRVEQVTFLTETPNELETKRWLWPAFFFWLWTYRGRFGGTRTTCAGNSAGSPAVLSIRFIVPGQSVSFL